MYAPVTHQDTWRYIDTYTVMYVTGSWYGRHDRSWDCGSGRLWTQWLAYTGKLLSHYAVFGTVSVMPPYIVTVTGFIGLQQTLLSSSVSPVSIQLTQRFKRVKMFCSGEGTTGMRCAVSRVVWFTYLVDW